MAEKKKAPMSGKYSKNKKNAVVSVPSKSTMNFVRHESSFNPKRVLPVLVVILILLAILTSVCIMGPLDQKTQAYRALADKQAQMAAVTSKLAGYEELAMQYGRYSYGWMNDSEVNLVSRMDVLNLVEGKIAHAATISNVAVNNNVLTLNISGITLEKASAMVKSLELSDLVVSASVYNAVAQDAEEAEIFMSIILTKEAAE